MKKLIIVLVFILVGILLYFKDTFINKFTINSKKTVISVNNNITKSKSDKRNYRMIILRNGLKALLISDPDTDEAAASMRVFAGSFDEPDDAIGIAHFTEHMLFLGNKKYPGSDYYSNYINSHRGMTNAFTSKDATVYYFNIVDKHLAGGLDIFAQFFISPLFTADLVDKEKNAVDSEYKMHIKNDFWRGYHVDKVTANPSHPYHNFTIGNLETLSSDSNATLRKKVINFYNKYYYSDNMALTIYGSEDLDALQKIVIDKFSDIRQEKTVNRKFDDIPVYNKENLGKLITFKTEGDRYVLEMNFPIANQIKEYHEKPADFIASMLNRKDIGTLHKYLIDKNMINYMSSYHQRITEKMSLFSVEFDLTAKGLNQYDEIVGLTFSYLKLISSNGIDKWRFDEIKHILQTEFNYAENSVPTNNVIKLLENINYMPVEDIITSRKLLLDFNSDNISSVLNKLNPMNMRIILGYKSAETNQVEPYFKVPYKVEDISDNMVNKWFDVAINDYFKLRQENKYVARNISPIFKFSQKNNAPKLVLEDPSRKIWYMPDLLFNKPQINISTMLNTKLFSNNIENSLLSKIYVELLSEYVSSKYASAIDALNLIDISRNKRGLIISLRGYSLSLLAKLISEINTDIMKFIPSSRRFAEIKEEMIRSYNNDKLSSPAFFSYYQSKLILEKNAWSAMEESKAIQQVTFTKMIRFIKTAFNDLFLESFVYGGVNDGELSNDFADTLSKQLNLTSTNDTVYSEQVIDVPAGAYHQILETNNPNHSVLNIYLDDDRNHAATAELLVLSGVLGTKFYEELRTQKQLGYVVHFSHYNISNVIGLWNVLESPGSNEQEINKEINIFTNSSAIKILNNLPNDELSTHKSSLISKLLKKPNNRQEVFKEKLEEIIIKRYDFNRRIVVAKKVSNITKEALLNRYKSLVINPDKRKYISIHTNKSPGNSLNKMKKLDDVLSSKV